MRPPVASCGDGASTRSTRGTGTGGLRGVSGFLGRTDIVSDGSARYRGYVVQR